MKFLSRKTNTVEKSAIVIGVFTLIGSVLSVLRNSLLASYLGASKDIDIYYASFRIPDFIFNIFIMGAITAGLIPLFSKYLNTKKEEANDFINSTILGIAFFSVVFGVILLIFANPIVDFLFKGLPVDSRIMVATMTRIIILQPVILGISSILGNMLLVFDMVVPFALAPLFYNLGIIFGLVFLYPQMGLIGLAYGVVIGAILNLMIKILPAKVAGFQWKFVKFSLFKKHMYEFGSLIVPRTLSVINIQLFAFVVTFFATFLPSGRLGIFNLANSLQEFPQTVFSSAIAIAAFPVLAKLFHQNKIDDLKKAYLKGFFQIVFVMTLVSSGLFVLKFSLVKLLLNYGNFDIASTAMTANVLNIMAVGLVFTSLLLMNLDTLFAMGDVYTPLIASFVAYSFGAGLIYFWYQKFDIFGITLALVLANFVYLIIMMTKILLKLKIGWWYVAKRFLLNLMIGVSSAIIGMIVLNSMDSFKYANRAYYMLFNLILPGFVIVLAYILLAKIFKIGEMNDFWNIIIKRFKKI